MLSRRVGRKPRDTFWGAVAFLWATETSSGGRSLFSSCGGRYPREEGQEGLGHPANWGSENTQPGKIGHHQL